MSAKALPAPCSPSPCIRAQHSTVPQADVCTAVLCKCWHTRVSSSCASPRITLGLGVERAAREVLRWGVPILMAALGWGALVVVLQGLSTSRAYNLLRLETSHSAPQKRGLWKGMLSLLQLFGNPQTWGRKLSATEMLSKLRGSKRCSLQHGAGGARHWGSQESRMDISPWGWRSPEISPLHPTVPPGLAEL